MGRTETRTRVAVGASLIFAACLGVAVAIPQARNAAVAAAVCVIVATVFVEAPEMTLLGFVVVRPVVDAFVYTSVGGLSLGEVWGIGLVAVTLAYLVAQEQVRMPLAPIALILAYASLTFVRPVLSDALGNWLKLASWLLLTVAISRIAAKRRGQQAILNAMLACAVVYVVVIVVVMAQGRYGAAYYGFSETGGGYSTPHALSTLAVLLLPFVLAQIIAGRRVALSLLLSGLLCLSIVYSFVRSAYLAVVAVLGAYALAAVRTSSLRVRLSVLAIFAAGAIAVVILRDAVVSRLVDLPFLGSLLGETSATPVLGGGSGRVALWRGLWAFGTDSVGHIFLGRGAGASYGLASQTVGQSIWSHNDFLEFFITGGLVLLACYIAVLVWVLLSFVRLYRDSRQSPTVHAYSIVGIGVFLAYVFLSAANGIAMMTGSVILGVLAGLVQGMSGTPEDTALEGPSVGPPKVTAEAPRSTATPRASPPAPNA